MNINIKPRPAWLLSDAARSSNVKMWVFDLICYWFILLFVYTAGSKILVFGSFSKAFLNMEFIGRFSKMIAVGILSAEILISLLLVVPVFKKLGMVAAGTLMLVFTVYLSWMELTGLHMPCGCGGIMASMSWTQHIWFNLTCVGLSVFGLALHRKI